MLVVYVKNVFLKRAGLNIVLKNIVSILEIRISLPLLKDDLWATISEL